MGRDIAAVLFVAVHRQNLQGKDVRGHRADLCEAALFLNFPDRCRQKVLLPVGVAAQPGPGAIEVVIGHQDLFAVRTDHPGGGGEVGVGIVPDVELLAPAHPRQQYLPVCGFLFIPGLIGLDLV